MTKRTFLKIYVHISDILFSSIFFAKFKSPQLQYWWIYIYIKKKFSELLNMQSKAFPTKVSRDEHGVCRNMMEDD